MLAKVKPAGDSMSGKRIRGIATALLAGVGTAALMSAATAADLAPYRPAPVAVVQGPIWTGGYFGGHISYSWSNLLGPTDLYSQVYESGFGADSYSTRAGARDTSSFMYGTIFGYNWQNGAWVYGIETDITRGDLSVSSKTVWADAYYNGGTADAGAGSSASVDWYGTLRARLGVVFAERFLVYGTAGLAYGKVDLHGSVGVGGSTGSGGSGNYSLVSGFHDSTVRAGWVAGAGIEYDSRIVLPGVLSYLNNMVIGVGYQYVDLGTVSASRTISVSGNDNVVTARASASADAAFHVVRLSATWRMGAAPSNAYAQGYGYGSPAAAMPGPGWGGVYVGGHVGGVWSTGDFLGPVSSTAEYNSYWERSAVGGRSASSFMMGAHSGINWQSGAWVYGIEMDGSVANINASSPSVNASVYPPYSNYAVHAASEAGASLSWLATVRGRVGFAWDRVLLYGTGGLATGKVNFAGSTNVGGTIGNGGYSTLGNYARFSESSIEWGYALGGGIDYQIRPDLIANLGYMYVDLGDISVARTAAISSGGNVAASTVNASTDLTFHVFRAGLSWRN